MIYRIFFLAPAIVMAVVLAGCSTPETTLRVPQTRWIGDRPCVYATGRARGVTITYLTNAPCTIAPPGSEGPGFTPYER